LGRIPTLGVALFTTLGFFIGAVIGGVIEGDAVGVLHVGVPGALIACVFARALVSTSSGR
jgi:hypothetical protein